MMTEQPQTDRPGKVAVVVLGMHRSGTSSLAGMLDGLGWMKAILNYSQPDSPDRAAQIARLSVWRAPTWRDYFDIVIDLLEDVTSSVS